MNEGGGAIGEAPPPGIPMGSWVGVTVWGWDQHQGIPGAGETSGLGVVGSKGHRAQEETQGGMLAPMGDIRTGPGGTLLQGTAGMDTAELQMTQGPGMAPGCKVTAAPGGPLDHLGGGIGSKGQQPQGTQGSGMTSELQMGTPASKRTTNPEDRDPGGHHDPWVETPGLGDSSFRMATGPHGGGGEHWTQGTPSPGVTPGPRWGPG